MVYLGRRVADCVKVFQQETLTFIGPLARNSCLNKYEHWQAFVGASYTTHQQIPFLYIINGINTNVKVSHEAKDLNPE